MSFHVNLQEGKYRCSTSPWCVTAFAGVSEMGHVASHIGLRGIQSKIALGCRRLPKVGVWM